MNGLNLELILPLLAIFIAAGFVKGVTGMGLPTVAMGLLGTLMPAPAAAALLLVPSFVTNVWQCWAGPPMGTLIRRLWPMLLAIAVGTVPGTALLVGVDHALSGLGLGIALLVYAGYALLGPPLTVPVRAEPWLSPLIGLLTGLVTGATGVFVIPAVPYLQSLKLDKDELVQALGLSFTVSTLALAAGLGWQGAFEAGQLGASTFALIPALIGMWLGQKLRDRLGPKRFRLYFLLFLMLLGLELVWRSIR